MQDLHNIIYLPRARARSPPVRRSRSRTEPWQPKAVRPGGCLNPHPQGVNLSSAARLACFPRAKARLSGFRRQRRHLYWRPKGRRTSPAGTVSQPIGKPFNGQAKGLLWLTWRSYAGPPQYYIPPEGESPQPACKAKPITGRTLAAQGRKARRLAQPSRP